MVNNTKGEKKIKEKEKEKKKIRGFQYVRSKSKIFMKHTCSKQTGDYNIPGVVC